MLAEMNYGREVARMSNERLIIELLLQIHCKERSQELLCIDEELEQRLVELDESRNMGHIDCMLATTSNLYAALFEKDVDIATGTVDYILKLLKKGGV